jgi:hypothetical protein
VVGYAEYLRAMYLELSAELELSIERTVSKEAEVGPFAFPVGLSDSVGGQRLSSTPYIRQQMATKFSGLLIRGSHFRILPGALIKRSGRLEAATRSLEGRLKPCEFLYNIR